MLVLGMTLILIQALFLPIGMVYAEPTIDTEGQEQVELPRRKNYLEEPASVPRFFFSQSHIEGTVEEMIQVEFFSDKEVSEVRVLLPEESTLIKDKLLEGVSAKQCNSSNEWEISAESAQENFILFLKFNSTGLYDISIGEEIIKITIFEKAYENYSNDLIESDSPSLPIISEKKDVHENFLDSNDPNDLLSVFDSNGNLIQGSTSIDNGIVLGPLGDLPMPMSGQFAIGQTMRFTGGGVYKNELIDILIHVPGWLGGLAPYDMQITQNTVERGVYLWHARTNTRMQLTITAVKSGTNEKIDGNIIVPQLYRDDKVVNIPKNNIREFAVVERDKNMFQIRDTRYDGMISIMLPDGTDSTGENWYGGMLIIDNGTTLEYETRRWAGALSFFATSAANMFRFPYMAPSIEGLADDNIAKYEIKQQLPKQFNLDFYPEMFEIEVGLDWRLFDQDNFDLDSISFTDPVSDHLISPSNVEKIDSGIRLSMTQNQLKTLSQGQEVILGLEIPITKDWSILESYYEDSFWILPATASNNQTEEVTTGLAKVGIHLIGEPIHQTVFLETSTNDLNLKELVTNMHSPDPNDIVSVIRIEEEQVFDSLGKTEITIIIEGSHSKVQTKVMVPVTVIEKSSNPLDPLNPEVEVEPENKPELPEDQGKLSIDFISSFNFGTQAISVHDQTYYAQPQRLLNEDGTVNESGDRPNYVQISDRRPETERNGWELAVTQKEQFKGEANKEFLGASLSLSNQQVITAQGGTAPGLQSIPCVLIPGNRRTLLKAQGDEGTGTWIYRFGDADTAGESVALNVPKGANPEATTYSATLIWELNAVPGN